MCFQKKFEILNTLKRSEINRGCGFDGGGGNGGGCDGGGGDGGGGDGGGDGGGSDGGDIFSYCSC